MTKCDNKLCSKEATCTPSFLVYAAGHLPGSHEPLKIYIKVRVCDEHVEDFKDHFANDDARKLLFQTLVANGKAPPNLDNIVMNKTPLSDPDFIQFLRITEANEKSRGAEPPGFSFRPEETTKH